MLVEIVDSEKHFEPLVYGHVIPDLRQRHTIDFLHDDEFSADRVQFS